jgi:hypothetical protein
MRWVRKNITATAAPSSAAASKTCELAFMNPGLLLERVDGSNLKQVQCTREKLSLIPLPCLALLLKCTTSSPSRQSPSSVPPPGSDHNVDMLSSE